MNIEPAKKTVLSVSQLNRRAKQLLETHLPLIWVSGEISNLARPSSGHWYFSLKDEQAQVRCAMFRNANARLRWQPQSGEQVLIRARVSLYEGRGEYQLIAEHMEPAGAGLLQQQYEMLKAKLEAEGLFDDARKQALPLFPRCIGIITSKTGAAIHDILTVLARRYPAAHIVVFPVSVQGNTAAGEMIAALNKAQAFGGCDVLIIGRGGGSIEDLWAFNDEQLARAIAACKVPIVSAVGHEVDFTIADFVADCRAPTPSASAEIISPDINEWLQALDGYHEQLHSLIKQRISREQQVVYALGKRLRHPSERIRYQQEQVLRLQHALVTAMRHRLQHEKSQLHTHARLLNKHHPSLRIHHERQQLSQQYDKLHKAMNNSLHNKQQQLAKQAAVLHAISPLAVLSRGYSIASQKDGTILKDTDSVNIGDEIHTKLASGYITSVVKQTSS